MSKNQITISEMAARGARARAKKLSKKRRSQIAAGAAKVRWEKHKATRI